MMFKLLPHGKGEGYGPVEYFCSQNPFGRGMRSTPPRVLKGNPALMRLQIDKVPFKWRYSSAVFSFAKEDNPTDAQITEVMDSFEELAFAGLPMSSRSTLWVLHEENGRKDLHMLTPRQEVHSGKSFNAFPPGWEKKYDLLRNMFNYKYGWARPDDPARARAWQPGANALVQADAKRKGKKVPSAEGAKITDHLANMVFAGKLQNRANIMQELKALGYELPRQGKDYLTVLEPKSGKRTRLKGTLYHADFNAQQWIAAEKAAFQRERDPVKIPDLEKSAGAEAALQKAIVQNATYNQKHYNNTEFVNVTRAEQHRRDNRETVQAEERQIYSRNRISAPSAGVSGVTYLGYDEDRDAYDGNKVDGTLSGSQKRITVTGKGSSASTGNLQQPADYDQAFFGLGGCAGEGYGVETPCREDITGGSAATDSDFAVHGGQTGRTPERQSTGAGGDAQLGNGHLERVEGTDNDFREFLSIQNSIREQADRIGQKLILAHDLLAMRSMAVTLSALEAPSLDGLQQTAEAVISKLPEVADLLLFNKIAAREAVLSPPPLQRLEDIALRVAEKLPAVNELKVLKETASGLMLLQPPSLSMLSDFAERVSAKTITVYDGKMLSGIHAAIKQDKALEYFNDMTRWAGGDLQRWGRVRRQCGKVPFLLELYRQEANAARNSFAELRQQAGNDSDNWRDLIVLCQDTPFLQRELALLIRKEKFLRNRSKIVVSPALGDASIQQEENGDINAFESFEP